MDVGEAQHMTFLVIKFGHLVSGSHVARSLGDEKLTMGLLLLNFGRVMRKKQHRPTETPLGVVVSAQWFQ